ncbi:MAG: hypothetical protein QOE92_1180 [Chloroflexota bacterium]|jgi:hypothetical protein|nr:hypothetical protein [Chloroflexota bacterium]
MRRQWTRSLLVVLAGSLLAGCAPTVSVVNHTKVGVTAIISGKGVREAFSPTPGESSTGDVKPGAFSVYVSPSQDWINHADDTKNFLYNQLLDPSKLTPAQVKDIHKKLEDLHNAMQQVEGNRLGEGCAGMAEEDGSYTATVVLDGEGRLKVTCK